MAAEPLGGLRGEVRALMEAYNRMVASRETRSAWREVDAAFIAPEWLVGRTIKVKARAARAVKHHSSRLGLLSA